MKGSKDQNPQEKKKKTGKLNDLNVNAATVQTSGKEGFSM